MAKKTANQLREEARKLMEQARELENRDLLEAGKLAKAFLQGELALEVFQTQASALLGLTLKPLPKAASSKP